MYDDGLNVWINGQHAGNLWRDERNEMGFQYSRKIPYGSRYPDNCR
jgi:hypothetical protein